MINLATDPLAKEQREAVSELVESFRELLSPNCPDIPETQYALKHQVVNTKHLNDEQIKTLRFQQRIAIENIRKVAFDIRDNGYGKADGHRLKTAWRLTDSTLWVTSGMRRLAIGLALGLDNIPADDPEPAWLVCPLCASRMFLERNSENKLEPKTGEIIKPAGGAGGG